MAMDTALRGAASGNGAEVTPQGELKVSLPQPGFADQAGYQVMMSEVHDGQAGVATRLVLGPETDNDYRIRAALDTPFLNETFPGTALNTSIWQAPVTTMTVAVASGFIALNSGNSVASAAVARLQSWRTFPIFQAGTLYAEVVAQHSVVPQANTVEEWGFGIATGTTAPTDGAFFRINGASQFQGVMISNGAETVIDLGSANLPAAGARDHWAVQVDPDQVRFWKDDVLLGTVDTPNNASGTTTTSVLPFFHRLYNSAAVSVAQQVKISNVCINASGYDFNRLAPTMYAGMGYGSYQYATGAASIGQTAQWTNSAAPANATLSNTAAGYATLGGLFSFAAVAGAATDYALFALQVPLGSASVPGRTLYIRGVRIETVNTGAAVATTPTILQWALGIGASAVSLATAESATAKAARRIPLGMQSFVVGDVVGKQGNTIDVNFDAAVVANSGEFVHIILRMPIGTATASQVLIGQVTINGFWE